MALEDLRQFTGTQQYHKLTMFGGIVFTDGMAYVAENAGAYWLMDVIATRCIPVAKRGEDFMTVRLTKNKTGNGALFVIEDGNGNKLAAQRIPFTDFPVEKFECYVARGERFLVAMLPSEY